MHSLSTSRSKHKIDNAMSTASFKSLSCVYHTTPLTSTTFVQRLSTVTSACPERGSDAGLHGKTIATNSDQGYTITIAAKLVINLARTVQKRFVHEADTRLIVHRLSETLELAPGDLVPPHLTLATRTSLEKNLYSENPNRAFL